MDKLAIGVIRTSHGVKGYLKVKSLSGALEHFFSLEEITLKKGSREKVFTVEEVKTYGSDDLLIKLQGINTLEDAKKFATYEIWVEKEKASQCKEGEYYIGDLCGCSVIFEGENVGKVKAVFENASTDLLEVLKKDGKMCIIPFLEDFVGQVDIAGKTIELKEGWFLN